MKISLASDHAGYQLKEQVKEILLEQNYEVIDRGCPDENSCDYPDFGAAAARDVAGGKAERAILVCGSGIGMSIVANKIKGVRAALCMSPDLAEMSRRHNDANALTLGARFLDPSTALQIVNVWLGTPFEGGRHQRRVEKISALEK